MKRIIGRSNLITFFTMQRNERAMLLSDNKS